MFNFISPSILRNLMIRGKASLNRCCVMRKGLEFTFHKKPGFSRKHKNEILKNAPVWRFAISKEFVHSSVFETAEIGWPLKHVRVNFPVTIKVVMKHTEYSAHLLVRIMQLRCITVE